jgi:S1-C subfamily serine protease
MSNMTIQLVRELRKGVVNVMFLPELAGVTSEEDLLRRLAPNVIRGTAFAVSAGHFLTCDHVVEGITDSKNLKLVGSPDPAKIHPVMHDVVEVKRDRNLDIALMRTERIRDEVVPIKLESGQPQVGLDILATGFPLPEQRPPEKIESEKRINVALAATFRAIRGIIASRLLDGLHFEIDKLLNPGQSGGPVVSLETGRLVGMCQAFRSYQVGTQMIPADLSVCLSVEAIRTKLTEWSLHNFI